MSRSSRKKYIIGVLLLALPNILQNLVTNMASMVDNLMVGGLQEHAIAGVTITNQVVFVFMIVLLGIGGTAGIFIPQFNGVGNNKKVTEAFKVSLVFSVIFSVAFFIIMFFVPEFILGFFATDPATIAEAMSYLRFIRYTFLILPISLAIGSGFRFIGHVKIPMYMSFIAVAINTTLNFGLIHGNFGLPALGVQGAALGTLISRLVELIIFIVLTIYIKSPIKLQLRSFFTLEKSMFKMFVEKGYGMVSNEFFWAFGMQVVSIIYTQRMSENIAAMSIASTFSQMMFIGMGGISVVFSIYLGKHLANNAFDLAKRDARRLKAISVVMGLSLGITVFIASLFLTGFFDVAPETLRTGMTILLINVVFSWLYYLNASYFFILRAGGDTKGVLIMDSFFTWVIMIPAAFLIGRFGLILPIHFLLVQLFEFIKCGLAHRRYRKNEWLNNLTT